MPTQQATISTSDSAVQWHEPNKLQPHIVVIGSGPVGIRFVQELIKRQPGSRITVFSNEPYQPYNRVQLSSVLAGDVDREAINLTLPDPQTYPDFSYITSAIHDLEPAEKTIIDSQGIVHSYDQLVIATGSRSFIPNIPGADASGVYTFRNLRDTDALYARISSTKHIVVVGGGLLGIEAARGLLRFNTKVTLIHQSDRLMNRQLDDTASDILTDKLEASGIEVITQNRVQEVLVDSRVKGVTLRNGETITCDTVLFCTGISANHELATRGKLKTNRGIIIDEYCQTSEADIYAIGECTEFKGETYGLVSPGFEQAAIAADNFVGGHARYAGSLAVSRLKVMGEHVCSMGEVQDFPKYGSQQEIIFSDQQQATYRKIVVQRGKLIGAVGIGEWPELPRIQELYQQQRRLYPWQLWHFRRSGKVWFNDASSDVNLWPKSAIVCQCNGIQQGQLVDAIDGGCKDLAALSASTNAGSVCGSCKPMLQNLLGYQGPAEKDRARLPILLASVIAIALAAAIYFIPGIMLSDTVQQKATLQEFWNDKFWKQVTGFSLLGMSVIGLLMSLRKRINSKRLGEFAYWRILHIVLGVFCVATLIFHTGLHLGENLNHYLMINFLLVILLGAFAGMAISFSHRLSPVASQKLRKSIAWVHILVTWPLPMLIGAHIVSVYYF